MMKLSNWSRYFHRFGMFGIGIAMLLLGTLESNAQDVSGLYYMDGMAHRRIIITHLTDMIYRIEEPSSSWPWDGSAIFDGKLLFGITKFKGGRGTMMVRGRLRGADGSMDIEYVFMTDADGNLASKIGPNHGRVDRHVWYKQK